MSGLKELEEREIGRDCFSESHPFLLLGRSLTRSWGMSSSS